MPSKKTTRSKKPARGLFTRFTQSKMFARVRKYQQSNGGISARAAGIAAVFIVGAAMLVGAHARSQSIANGAAADAGHPGVKTAAARGIDTSLAPSAGGGASTSKAHTATAPPVTITGCLERNDEGFRLKDTTGADAPKSRSWKSGFLHKSNAAVTVTDSSNRWRLPDHVGQRVSVTGNLVDKEMQVRSLQRVATSCSAS